METKNLTVEQMAEMIVNFSREHDVQPDEDFVADAGRDYGYVAAWEMPHGGYALAYGDNGETNYDIADDTDDLGQWLIHDNLSGTPAALIEAANVYGLDGLVEAETGNSTGYAIMISRSFLDGTTRHDLDRDRHGDIIEYATLAEAQEAAEGMDGETYVEENGESGRPAYTVVML